MRRELGPERSRSELLQWTEETFGTDFIVASNMQDAVLVHLAAQVRPGCRRFCFLDTGYHFAETIGTRDAVETVYGVEHRECARPSRLSPNRISCWARTCSLAMPPNAAACARWCR